ncbi:MAG: Uncharacterized protein XD60_0719 [Acetothermia bacterium 64_32]|nr:MAG: Uncharacterized protein XD60_0719 [Acetothermia bacterium 64_32]HAF70581.1 hypothetical protein [Candidatus Acetothermia bacterium]
MDKDVRQWLAPLARRWGLEGEVRRQGAVFAWPEAVGEQLAKLARALYVDGHTLHVAVASPVVAMELRHLQGKLLARLREVAPDVSVKRLRFHVRPQAVPPRGLKVEEPREGDWQAAEQAVPPDLPAALRARLVRIAAWALARDRAILEAGGHRCPRCGVAHLGPEELCPPCFAAWGGEG